MQQNEQIAAIECMLFVAGDPVPITELQRVLDLTELELRPLLYAMQEAYKAEARGLTLMLTEETAQLVSNRAYARYVEELLQPAQQKTFSQSLLETLAVIAYRQPITRAEVEAVRGVRCEYAVSQLLKMNMIQPMGRKDSVGRPVLYGTTDAFLRHFGIASTQQLPNYEAFKKGIDPDEKVETLTV